MRGGGRGEEEGRGKEGEGSRKRRGGKDDKARCRGGRRS